MIAAGLRLAVTTFTVLPLPSARSSPGPAAPAPDSPVPDRPVPDRPVPDSGDPDSAAPDSAALAGAAPASAALAGVAPDPRAGAVAMAVAPLVGGALGAVLGGIGLGLRELGTPPLVAGTVLVAGELLLTRGLHIDGLADTVDGLGSYQGRERALQIMKEPAVGAFGVAAIAVTLLTQAASLGALLGRATDWTGRWAALAGIVAALATGRLAATWGCRTGVPAARPGGLGALVAGTVPAPVALLGTLAVVACSVPAIPGRAWQGPVAVVVGLGSAALVQRQAVRRLGGITGDVLGALVVVAQTVYLVVLAI